MTRALIPNSTQIPDVILDQWMCELSGAELKVVLYIARRTFGFGKQSDNVSLNQISNGIKKRDGIVLDRGTGLSVSSVARALKSLEEQTILIRKTNINDKNEHDEKKGGGCDAENKTWSRFSGGKSKGRCWKKHQYGAFGCRARGAWLHITNNRP